MPIRKRPLTILEPPLEEPPFRELAPFPENAPHDTPYPDDIPLDHTQVEAALWHAGGNLHRTASLFNTRPGRIAYLVSRIPHLQKARAQAAELLLDKAEATILEALEDAQDTTRADNAARFVLEKAGKQRGWSKDGGGLSLAFGEPTPGSGQIAIRWDIE